MNTAQNKSIHHPKSSAQWHTMLKIVAYFITISSIVNLIISVLGIAIDRYCYNFGILDLFNILAGSALLKHYRGWRIYLLIYLCFSILVGIPAITGEIVGEQINHYRIFQNYILFVERIGYIGCLFVLYHPKVRKMFPANK